MANGDLIKLGTFYLAGAKKVRPTKPWRSDTTPPGAPSVGDIPSFSAGQTIEIRDTDASDAYKIQWREVKDGAKKLLIADRVLLAYVSWDDLNAQGLVSGKTITIDGQQYKLRLLTGGSNYRTGTDAYSGGTPTTNEWDRILVNEAGFSGLPVPVASDLDGTQNATDFNSAHNQFWNWYYMYSWAQETYTGNSAHRAVRGYYSARLWGFGDAAYRYNSLGWRPVLEVLNSVPSVTLTTADNQTLQEGNSFTLTGSVSDADGNIIVVKAKLNNGTEQTIYNSTNGNFSVQYNVNQLIAGDNFVTFTADDGQGGIVTKQMKITNTPRPVKPFTLINESNFIVDGKLSIVGTGETESYSPMTKTSYGVKDYIAEDQLLGSVGTPNSQATVKLTLTRANTNMDKKLHGFLGAIE